MEPLNIEVPAQLFAPAESLSFSGEYQLGQLEQGVDTYTFANPLSWEVSISNTGGALLVTGIVSGEAQTSCVRCLEPAEYSLEGEVEGYYLIPDSDVQLTEEEKRSTSFWGKIASSTFRRFWLLRSRLSFRTPPCATTPARGFARVAAPT